MCKILNICDLKSHLEESLEDIVTIANIKSILNNICQRLVNYIFSLVINCVKLC